MEPLQKTLSTRTLLPFLFLFCFAAWLRYWELGAHSLWTDEQDSLMQSRGLLEIWNRRGNGILYFALLHHWRGMFGDSALALRSLSAGLGTISVLLVSWIAYRMSGSRKAAFIAGVLSCCLPILVWHSRDARMYPLWGFGFLLAVHGLVEFRQRGPLVWVCFQYFLGQAIGLLTHSFHLFWALGIVMAGFLLIEGRPRQRLKQVAILNAPFILLLMLYGLRFLVFPDSPYSYLKQWGYSPWDFHLIPSLEEVFLYGGPAQERLNTSIAGTGILVLFSAASYQISLKSVPARAWGQALVCMSWGAFLLMHVLPVRDYARLFFPMAFMGSLVMGLALSMQDEGKTLWQKFVRSPWVAIALILGFFCLPLRRAFIDELEPWKTVCAEIQTLPSTWAVIAETGQPESPIAQCTFLDRLVIRHGPYHPVTKAELSLLKQASGAIVLRSPPWVNQEDSVVHSLGRPWESIDWQIRGPYLTEARLTFER